jgi:uncharacterized protein (DUF433 family)
MTRDIGFDVHARWELITGLYTIAEVARYLKKSPATIAKWKRHFSIRRHMSPLSTEECRYVAFMEFIEMWYVKAFRDAGVSLGKIRRAAERLQEEWGLPYPFASGRVDATSLKSLIVENVSGELESADVGQKVFEFIEQFRLRLRFGDDHLPEAWFPLGLDRTVVLDPSRSFGAPIDKGSGVPTSVLAVGYEVEHEDIARVAWWYGVSEQAVQDAVEFERSLAA